MEKLFGSGVDESILEELEETLLMADVEIQTTTQIIEQVRQASDKDVDLKSMLKEQLLSTMSEDVPLIVRRETSIRHHDGWCQWVWKDDYDW